jgi:hypothetical protein
MAEEGKKKKDEAASNNGMQNYYLISCLIFGLLSFYCFTFWNTWNTGTCLYNDPIPKSSSDDTSTDTTNSTANGT